MLHVRVWRLRGFSILYICLIHINRSDQQAPGTCEFLCGPRADCTNRGLLLLPPAAGTCRGIERLVVTNNQITSLEESTFSSYRQIRSLFLQENQITSIGPLSFLPIQRTLRTLNISRNLLTSIGERTFVNMTRLEYIFADYNQIESISPDAFQGMQRLQKLFLGDNNLVGVDQVIFSAVPNLREVNLRNNRLIVLDLTVMGRLWRLQKIFVHDNSIEEIVGEMPAEHSSLTLINLSGNRLERFDCGMLGDPPEPPDIYLSDNALQTVTNCNGPQISRIRLQDNPLHCSCNLLRDLARSLGDDPALVSPTCATPEGVQGLEVRVAVIRCDDAPTTSAQIFEETSEANYNPSNRSYHDHHQIKTTEVVAIPFTAGSSVKMLVPREENLISKNNNNDPGGMGNFFTNQNNLFYGMVTLVGILLIIVIILFSYFLKSCCFCFNCHSKKKKGYPKGEQTYFDVEDIQVDSRENCQCKDNQCRCRWFPLCCRKEGVYEIASKTAPPVTNIDHSYARAVSTSTRSDNPCPQFIRWSESESNAMIVRLPASGGYLQVNDGVIDYGVDATPCTCSCDCVDHTSQHSFGSGYTDSNESYEAENQLNERSSHHERGEAECQQVMIADHGSTPYCTRWSDQQNNNTPPRPSQERNKEPIYIQHDQI